MTLALKEYYGNIIFVYHFNNSGFGW